MGFVVETKDCTAVTDAELAEMADLCAEHENSFPVGLLSKQNDEWVLVAIARENEILRGYVYATLERIGGTPAIVLGLGVVARNSRRDTTLRSLRNEIFHRALMAFPDEDVLLGAQLGSPHGLEIFDSLEDVVPRPGHKANGEQRAWGRRLAKRYSIGASRYNDRKFVAVGDGGHACIFDHESDDATFDDELAALFDEVEVSDGGSLIVCGWVPAVELVKFG